MYLSLSIVIIICFTVWSIGDRIIRVMDKSIHQSVLNDKSESSAAQIDALIKSSDDLIEKVEELNDRLDEVDALKKIILDLNKKIENLETKIKDLDSYKSKVDTLVIKNGFKL